MKQYKELLNAAILSGVEKQDRTGTGTISIFGNQMRFDLQKGFPALTTKKLYFKAVVAELLWFLSGSTNVKVLQQQGCHIWDEWADSNGDLGPVYGAQWVSWKDSDGISHNQIQNVIDQIKKDRNSRRLVVSAWNVGDLGKMALVPCHAMFQFYVSDNKLSCQVYQRSADIFLGVPFNIASYALLTHIIAQQCNLEVGDFVWTGGDCHIYKNHLEQVTQLLNRTVKSLPELRVRRIPDSVFSYKTEDFELLNYDPHPAIRAPIAI